MKKGILIKILISILIIIAIIFAIILGNNKQDNYNNQTINKNVSEVNMVENIITEEVSNVFDETYLGEYVWEKESDTIYFSLTKENNEIHYFMSYYPYNSIHASEELWGKWDTSNENIELLDNINTYSLANYSISNIKYSDNRISMNIKLKEILSEQFKEVIIPDGEYTFVKSN